MSYCSVKHCQNNASLPNRKVFKVREEWQALNCWKNEVGAKICDEHFSASSLTKKRRLKKSSVPSKFYFNSVRPISAEGALADHKGYVLPDPRELKRRLDENTRRGIEFEIRAKRLKRNNERLVNNQKSLQNVISNLQTKFDVSDSVIETLNKASSALPKDLFERTVKKLNCEQKLNEPYSSALKTFALTLNLHSPAAYRYVNTNVRVAQRN